MKAKQHHTLYWTIPLLLIVLGSASPMPADGGGPGTHCNKTVYEITRLPSLGGTQSSGPRLPGPPRHRRAYR